MPLMGDHKDQKDVKLQDENETFRKMLHGTSDNRTRSEVNMLLVTGMLLWLVWLQWDDDIYIQSRLLMHICKGIVAFFRAKMTRDRALVDQNPQLFKNEMVKKAMRGSDAAYNVVNAFFWLFFLGEFPFIFFQYKTVLTSQLLCWAWLIMHVATVNAVLDLSKTIRDAEQAVYFGRAEKG